jgi:hypothetical protein
MSESPPEGGGGGGNILTRKFAGVPVWVWAGAVITVGAAAYLIYRSRKAAASSSSTTAAGATSGGCTDASGNPVDCGSTSAVSDVGTSQWEALYTQDQGIESTLNSIEAQIAGLQGSGTTPSGGTTGTSTPTPTPGPTAPAYPLTQTGTVYSSTTKRTGKVDSTDGGKTWTYDGVTSAKNEPQNQAGTVTSTTTGLTGKVTSSNGGQTWIYAGVPSST